jgi:serine/threonine-protein kinase RsbW
MIFQTMALSHDVRRRLELDSSLTELARVAPWVGELADEYDISGETRFAIELCLEEVLSNIVRHGYRGEAGRQISIDFSKRDGDLIFVVEDSAPHFEPLEPEDVVPESLDTITPGGQGIRLLYRFAGSVKYERLDGRNRLTIGFQSEGEN